MSPAFSFDYNDVITLGVALIAVMYAYVNRRQFTKATSEARTEIVDDSVLAQFSSLHDRITRLELEQATTKKELAEARVEIRELKRLEEYLNARLHEKSKQLDLQRELLAKKDLEITDLTARLESYRHRLLALETFVESKLDGIPAHIPEITG